MNRLDYVKKEYPELSENEIKERCPSFHELEDCNLCNGSGRAGLCKSCWESEEVIVTNS